MKRVKDILTVLVNYQKIVELTSGAKDKEIDEVIDLLKPYKTLSIDEIKKKLEGEEAKNKKVSPREQAIKLGEYCYRLKTTGGLTEEEQFTLATFMAIPENKVLIHILESPFDESYKEVNEIPDKSLTVPQLLFLGSALLNIKLKGRNKADQKKNLLDVLWTVIENQKMNEIYESRL